MNEQGHELQANKNFKKSLNPSNENIFYTLDAFDRRYLLNLTINQNLFAPNFHIEKRNPDGSVSVSNAPHRNFYHGHVISNPGSLVALSDNQGLVSIFKVTFSFLRVVFSTKRENHEKPCSI